MSTPDFPPIKLKDRLTVIELLRSTAQEVHAGKISTVLLATIDTDGTTGSGSGASYASDVAQMLRVLAINHFSCECGEAGCTTNATRQMLLAILEPYIAGTDSPSKGN